MIRSLLLLAAIVATVCALYDHAATAPKLRERIEIPGLPLPRGLANRAAQEEAIGLVDGAIRRIPFYDLLKPGELLSEEVIAEVLKREASTLALARVKDDPRWGFDALSGKLTFKQSLRVGSGEISLGEANVYKIVGIVAVPVAACALIDTLDGKVQCVRRTLESQGRKETPLDGSGPRGMTVRDGEDSPAK